LKILHTVPVGIGTDQRPIRPNTRDDQTDLTRRCEHDDAWFVKEQTANEIVTHVPEC
jgi:hypothetical protein